MILFENSFYLTVTHIRQIRSDRNGQVSFVFRKFCTNLHVSFKRISVPAEFFMERNVTLRNFFKKYSRETDILESL